MNMASNRKKGDYSVLSEVNTEEEWLTLLERNGLVVVDVYSEWSGPCSAMTNFLKKIKLEVNDDLLHYAMAKSDTIPQLEVFRGQCKPTWLFMSGGEPVAVMHGANAPLLQKMIEKEIRRERQVLKGEACRETINLEDAVPVSVKSKSKASENLWADTDEEDNADSVDGDANNEDDGNDGQANFTILAVEPYIYEDENLFLVLKDILMQEEFSIFQERDVVLTLDDIKFLTSGTKTTEDQMDLIVTKLLELQVKIFMLRAEEGVKASKRMNEILGQMFAPAKAEPEQKEGENNEEESEKPAEESEPPLKKTAANVNETQPDAEFIIFPEGLRAFFETLDNEKQPGFLCPDYAGFLGITEKHFYESLSSVLDDPNVDCRKALLVFPEDTKEFIENEISGFTELEIKVIGTCCTTLNKQKAQLLVNKRRKIKELNEDELLLEMSHLDAFAAIIKRETDKETRHKQNEFIKELDPLVFTLHLGSMKIFFQNIETEEKTVDGEVLGELDQGYSSGEEEAPPD